MGSPEWERQRWGGENEIFSSCVHQYLENGSRYVQSYYQRLIRSCVWTFDWHQGPKVYDLEWLWAAICSHFITNVHCWMLIFKHIPQVTTQVRLLSEMCRTSNAFARWQHCGTLTLASAGLSCCRYYCYYNDNKKARLKLSRNPQVQTACALCVPFLVPPNRKMIFRRCSVAMATSSTSDTLSK